MLTLICILDHGRSDTRRPAALHLVRPSHPPQAAAPGVTAAAPLGIHTAPSSMGPTGGLQVARAMARESAARHACLAYPWFSLLCSLSKQVQGSGSPKQHIPCHGNLPKSKQHLADLFAHGCCLTGFSHVRIHTR